MRAPLVKPAGLAVVRIARKNAARPFVVAWALISVPGTGIGRTVVDEIELWIIGNPARHRTATHPPSVRWPGGHPQIFPRFLRIKRFELWSNAHISIWS